MSRALRSREEANQRLRNQLEAAARRLDFKSPTGPSISALRRGYRPSRDTRGLLTLIERDGVLVWFDSPVFSPLAAHGAGPAGDVVFQKPYEKIDPSHIGEHLTRLDADLTRTRGLRRYANGRLSRPGVVVQAASRKILLFVHGAFSSGSAFFHELQAMGAGRELLEDALAAYDEVFFFDHYTVSISPMLNALDLARHFAGSGADVDVVCHGRGGLVARWWLEALDRVERRRVRAIYVATPHAGTSLAAPDRIRPAMSLFANIARAAEMVGTAVSTLVPFATVAAGVMHLLSSTAGAAVTMMPGLAAVSKGNNEELSRLNADMATGNVEYYAVLSDFEPDQAESWGSELRVFPGANDLVVDRDSMIALPKSRAPKAVCDFGKSGLVYHANYFRQARTLGFIREAFEIGGSAGALKLPPRR